MSQYFRYPHQDRFLDHVQLSEIHLFDHSFSQLYNNHHLYNQQLYNQHLYNFQSLQKPRMCIDGIPCVRDTNLTD